MSKSLPSRAAVLASVCASGAVGLATFACAAWFLTGLKNGIVAHTALATGTVVVASILMRLLPSVRPMALAFAVALLGCLGFSFLGYPALLTDKARSLAADGRYCLANSESLLPLEAKEDLSLMTIEKWWRELRPYRYPFSGVSQGVVLAVEVGDQVPNISDGLAI